MQCTQGVVDHLVRFVRSAISIIVNTIRSTCSEQGTYWYQGRIRRRCRAVEGVQTFAATRIIRRHCPGLHRQRFDRDDVQELTVVQGCRIAHARVTLAGRHDAKLWGARANAFCYRNRSLARAYVATWVCNRQCNQICTKVGAGKLTWRNRKPQICKSRTVVKRTVVHQLWIKYKLARLIQYYRCRFA